MSVLPGWYIARQGDGLACFYHHGRGWWTIGGRKQRLPEGWIAEESIDSLLNKVEGFKLDRREIAA